MEIEGADKQYCILAYVNLSGQNQRSGPQQNSKKINEF